MMPYLDLIFVPFAGAVLMLEQRPFLNGGRLAYSNSIASKKTALDRM